MASVWPAKNNYATGDVLTAANMNGVGDDLNDVYNFSGYAAGKNKIINGDFGIWQRGTSFSNPSGTYCADRWLTSITGGSGGTTSQQTFTAGTAPVSGYEGTYFMRLASNTGATYMDIAQRIEDVRTFAGQTITLSFWAKATSPITFTAILRQNFGSGGSANVDNGGATINISSSSWTRYTYTVAPIASIAGKTIGTGSYLAPILYSSGGTIASNTVDIWGVQVEAGSTVSIFQTATGTKQGELAACQRYYWRSYGNANNTNWNLGSVVASGYSVTPISNPVEMRVAATSMDISNVSFYEPIAAVNYSPDTTTTGDNTTKTSIVRFNKTTLTNVGRVGYLNGGTTSYIGFSAEL